MKRLLLLSTAVILISSCHKKKKSPETAEEVTPAVTYADYSRLKTGNYWIYGRFQVEADGTVTDKHQSDSCYVEKDTLIGSRTFYKLRKRDLLLNLRVTLWLRDSLHYTVDSHGTILFSSQDFSTTFDTNYFTLSLSGNSSVDTLYKITHKMADRDLAVTTPAGTFNTSNMQSTYFPYPASITAGGNGDTRYMNMRYAQNVGLIVETEPFLILAPFTTERRLIRYHLQ